MLRGVAPLPASSGAVGPRNDSQDCDEDQVATDQTKAKAEALKCNNPCRSATRGDLILIHDGARGGEVPGGVWSERGYDRFAWPQFEPVHGPALDAPVVLCQI